MVRFYLLVCVLTSALCPLAYADSFAATLDEAEAYLTVNPAHTLALLDKMGEPDKLPVDVSIRRNILLLRAAVPTNQMDRLIQALDSIFEHHQHAYFQQQLTPITSALGIWLRRNNYLHDAQLSFACSYRYATTDRQRLTLTNSMALLAMELDEHATAHTLFDRARLLAKQSGQTNVLAMVENNLGLLALDEGKLQEAEQYFRAALAYYQSISQRSGQISAGINLLFSFLLQEELDNFQRLYSPTTNLTASFPNEAKQALLFWLETRFGQMQGKAITARMRQQLLDSFEQMEDNKVRILLHRYLAPRLEVDVKRPEAASRRVFERTWFTKVTQCDWPLIRYMNPALHP